MDTSYFVYMLIVAIVQADGRQTVPERGVVTSRDVLNFGGPSISQKWMKLELSNFVQREIISSCQMGEKSP